MVCLGPSKACRRCKKHKVKCDEAKPSCKNCMKAGSVCVGNEAFRDQTRMIKQKVHAQKRTPCKKQSGHAGKAKYIRKNECNQQEDRYSIGSVSPHSLCASISQCPEQLSLCFYVSHLLPLLPGYYTDEIPDLLVNDSNSSILSIITQATALNFMALLPQYAHYRVLAVSKYAQALRSVRQAISDPILGMSDALLLAILMLGTWEHSHSLNSGSSQISSHMIGAMAMIRTRLLQQSKYSSLFLRLFRFVRAAVIYHCIEYGNNQPLDSFSACVHDSSSSDMCTAVEETADNGFCALAELACNVPQLLNQARLFLERADQQATAIVVPEAAKILDGLKMEEKNLVSWLSFTARHQSQKARQTSIRQAELWHGKTSHSPSRSDIDIDAPHAASCNSWRLCRILVLDSMAKIAHVLATIDITTTSWSADTLNARSRIQELVDEICASMPRYLGEINKDQHFRRVDGHSQCKMTREELIANWSQMKSILSKGSELDCVSMRQRQWMNTCVRMLSDEKTRFAKIIVMPSTTAC